MLQGHSDIDVYIKKQKQTKKITNKLFFYPFSQKNKQIFENPQCYIDLESDLWQLWTTWLSTAIPDAEI